METLIERNATASAWREDRALPLLKFPYDHRGKARLTYKKLEKRFDTAPNSGGFVFKRPFFAALTAAFLYRYTQSADIVLGLPGAKNPGRQAVFAFGPGLTFRRLLEECRKLGDEADAINESQAQSLAAHQVFLHFGKPAIPDVSGQGFELGFYIENAGEAGFTLGLVYAGELFKERTAERVLENYHTFCSDALNNPGLQVMDLEILPQKEKDFLLKSLEGHKKPEIFNSTITSLIDGQVRLQPNKVAVVAGETRLTYLELDRRANRLARCLIQGYNVGKGDFVAALVGKNETLAVAVLGILKTGAAYLPLSEDTPQKRIQLIVENTSCKALVCESAFAGEMEKTIAIPIVDIGGEAVAGQDPARINRFTDPDGLLCILVTSGSTGAPKGVEAPNNGHLNHTDWLMRQTAAGPGDNWLLVGAYNVIFSCSVIFGALTTGGILHIIEDETLLSNENLLGYILKEKISHIKIAPSLFHVLVNHDRAGEALASLRQVVFAGSPMDAADAQKLLEINREVNIINHYGATETSGGAAFSVINQKYLDAHRSALFAGKAIDNIQAYVLDDRRRLVPTGMEGEICFAGPGAAKGYLNMPEATAERFIPSPYHPGMPMYRMGDVGKTLPDGLLEYLGRKDFMVKVRGFRIELQEIEHSLMGHPAVKQAVVLARDANGEKELVAFLTLKENQTATDNEALKAYLSEYLPHYMIPARFKTVAAFPFTQNHKIDGKKLLELPLDEAAEYETPVTETEKALAGIWAEALNAPKVGRDDDFFRSGGHSIKAMRSISAIAKVFGIQLGFSEFFFHPILWGQAKMIDDRIAGGGVRERESDIPALLQTSYPASGGQERLWLVAQQENAGRLYAMQRAVGLDGGLDIEALHRAEARLLERHAILNSNFVWEDGALLIKLRQGAPLPFRFYEAKNKEEAEKLLLDENGRGFDLAQDPLFFITLIKISEIQHLLLIKMHHIVSDGWSMDKIGRELSALYGRELSGTKAALPEIPVQFGDYAVWLQNNIRDGRLAAARAYWLGELSGELPVTDFPTDFPRSKRQAYQSRTLRRAFAKAPVERFCREKGVTMFMFLTAWIQTLIHRYTGQTDIVIGTVSAGRQHPDLYNLIGFFANTLALRNRLAPEASFAFFLEDVKQSTLRAYQHEIYPFGLLLEELDPPTAEGRHPLFDMLVVLQNNGEEDVFFEGIHTQNLALPDAQSQFDLVFEFVETKNALELRLAYSEALFAESTIERLFGHLETLLQSVLHKPGTKISELEILTEGERRQILEGFNDTRTDYPKDRTIVDLFAEQASKTPHNIAVVFEGGALAYKELDAKSNQLANYLLGEYAIKPDDLVGIMMERSEMQIVGMLGILKSGAAYVPIDPGYPQSRIDFILKDTGCRALIADQAYPCALSIHDGNIWSGSAEAPHTGLKPGHLAYVIYTSGSTGTPKGVMIEHGNVIRLVKNSGYLHCSEHDVFLFAANPSFDAATFEIWMPLLHSARLVVATKADLLSTPLLKNLMIRHGITTAFFTTGLFNQIAEAQPDLFEPLHTLLTGGERHDRASIKKIKAECPQLGLSHVYGPTENTTFSTAYPIFWETPEAIPIGHPIANSSAYILDAAGAICPIGIAGEIHLGGDGLARGYLNRPELTAEKFIPNPFKPGERMYKSGDMGRWLPDGNIEFLGRIDHQVKIRGFRIETGEIEHILSAMEGIKACCVLSKEIGGQNELIAFFVAGQEFPSEALRLWLAKTLPAYMLPAYFVQVPGIPLNANGKADRKALLGIAPEGKRNQDHQAPETETEKALAAIWEDLLGAQNPGLADDFFRLGGHSLKAMRLANQIQNTLHVKVSIQDVFENPVLADLANLIARSAKSSAEIPKAPVAGLYPATFFQAFTYWYAKTHKSAFTMTIPIEARDAAAADRLCGAICKIVERHDSLRSVFTEKDGNLFQYFRDPASFGVKRLGAHISEAEAMEEAKKPIDLENENLFQALRRESGGKTTVFIKMHHLVYDGISLQDVFFKELTALYSGEPLEALPIQISDYCVWKNSEARREERQNAKEYWAGEYATLPALLQMPDEPRPQKNPRKAFAIQKGLGQSAFDRLTKKLAAQNTTLLSFTTAVLNVLLFRYTGQQEIVTTILNGQRQHILAEKLIGFLLEEITVLNVLHTDQTFAECLKQTQNKLLMAFKHGAYNPIELDEAKMEELMYVLMNVHTYGDGQTNIFEAEGLYGSHLKKAPEVTYPIEIDITTQNGDCVFNFAFMESLFTESTGEFFVDDYFKFLETALNDPGTALKNFDRLLGKPQPWAEGGSSA